MAAVPLTSVLQKTTYEAGRQADDGEVARCVPPQEGGETLVHILARMGAQTWQARAMTEAARAALLPDGTLNAGQDLSAMVLPR